MSPDLHTVQVSKTEVVNGLIEHQFFICEIPEKFDFLVQFLQSQGAARGIVFCRTKADAQAVTRKLIAKKFLADAIHGDLGMIGPEDVVMIISKSGESPEIKLLVDLVAHFGNPLIAMVGNVDSYLGKATSLIINTTVDQEACIHNLAPTSSTTAQMVMGDLMAMAFMELKGFKTNDFAKFHPGGNLGKRLTLTTGAIAKQNTQPSVQASTSIKEVIIAISKSRMGATVVLDESGAIIGMITDGDIRRMLEQHNSIQDLKAADIFHKKPITISSNTLAIEAFDLMKMHDISQLIVADEGQYKGMIHMHDLMKEGIL